MSIQEMDNTPIQMVFSGRTLKIQRLSIKEYFGVAEAKVKENYIKNIQQVSYILSGKDKIDYLQTATRDIPSGDKLLEESMEWMKSPDGIAQILYIGLNKHQVISESEITNLLMTAKENEANDLLTYLLGITTENNTTETDKKK